MIIPEPVRDALEVALQRDLPFVEDPDEAAKAAATIRVWLDGTQNVPSQQELHREMWIQEAVGRRGFDRKRAEAIYETRLKSEDPDVVGECIADKDEAYWYHRAFLALFNAPQPAQDK
jgi:hypothetical protein